MVRGLARMLAVAALLTLAAPARAVTEQSFTTSGSITITWQGDPASGCGALGLCGVQGALILRSQGGSSSSGGPPGRGIDVPFDSGSTVRVSDGSGAGRCVDTGGIPGGGLFIGRRGGRMVASVDASLSSGRCAGPLQQDLAGLALPVRRSAGKYPSYDLRTSQSFAAGPFTGRVVSTVVVRSMPNPPGSGSSSFPGPPGTPPLHKVFLEQVTLRYRLASLPGSLDVAFSGEPDPFCAALDSCGASGTLALTLPGLRRSFVVVASRQVSRRADARQVLADFRRGRLRFGGGFPGPGGGGFFGPGGGGFFGPGPGGFVGPGGGGFVGPGGGGNAAVTETYAGSGGLRCQSASDNAAPPQLLVGPGSGRMGAGVSVVLANVIGSDLVRTYCPGPSETDVFGSSAAVARASIGISQLLARQSAISLTAPGSFAGLGYVGTRGGGLSFSLTLERVHAGTVQVARP